MSPDRIGIDYLSCTELSAIERAHVAADLGCGYFGMSVDMTGTPHQRDPERSLSSDRRLRQDLAAVMADRGVAISLAEGIALTPDNEVADWSPDFDVLAELGAETINVYSIDPDRSRTVDQLGTFAGLAASRGLRPVFEFVPCLPISSLDEAIGIIRDVGHPQLGMVLDLMHVLRSGCTAAQLAAVDPAMVGHVQVCDVPLAAQVEDYGDEACHYRLPFGEGDVPLREYLGALPRHVPLGVEAPMLVKTQAGVTAQDRLRSSVVFLRDLLAGLDVRAA